MAIFLTLPVPPAHAQSATLPPLTLAMYAGAKGDAGFYWNSKYGYDSYTTGAASLGVGLGMNAPYGNDYTIGIIEIPISALIGKTVQSASLKIFSKGFSTGYYYGSSTIGWLDPGTVVPTGDVVADGMGEPAKGRPGNFNVYQSDVAGSGDPNVWFTFDFTTQIQADLAAGRAFSTFVLCGSRDTGGSIGAAEGGALVCPHIVASVADDHGNSPGTATNLPLGATGGASASGGIQTPADIDFFRIVFPGQSTAHVILTGLVGQKLQIYKSTNMTTPWKSATIAAGVTKAGIAAVLPKGVFFVKVTGATGNYSLLLGSRLAGDFNADRKADMLWRDTSTGRMSVWYMNARTRSGSAIFASQPVAPWQLVNTADFNGDMKPDLVLQNTVNGDVAIWHMNGLALLNSGPLNIQMGSKDWCVAATGDYNQDGMTDLLYQHRTTGNVQVRYVDWTRKIIGSGVFPQQLSSVYRLCGTGDTNGDGSPDIVWQNRNTGTITVIYLNGLATLAGGGGLSVQPSLPWEVAAVEDRNGDGKADLAMQHKTTGQAIIWFLNGRTVLAGGGATSAQQSSALVLMANSRP